MLRVLLSGVILVAGVWVVGLMLVCRLVQMGATVAASAVVLGAMALVVAVLAALSWRRLLVLLAVVSLWIGGACSTAGSR